MIGELNDADNRMQRREWISGDFGPRRGDFSEQRRFAGIWITNESRIRDRAELQQKMTGLAFCAFGVFARRAIARTLEMDISFSARAPFAKNEVLFVAGKIDNRIDCGLQIVNRGLF